MKYIILKQIKNEEVKLPVVLIDSLGEVLEFEDLQEAEKTRDLFQNNTDSGHIYEIKKTGSFTSSFLICLRIIYFMIMDFWLNVFLH